MRKAIALMLGALLPVLGLSGTGQAQSSIQVEGTIQAVDCSAQTVVLNRPGVSNTVVAAPYTAVLVNSTSVPFCSLQQYLGAPASAWLVASGSEFVATRIDVSGYASAPPTYAPAPSYPYYPPQPPVVVQEQPPIAGIVLGTIVVAGLLFLLVRDHDGHYHRYPYYGPYHRQYYRPEYRPYRGPYHDAPVRWEKHGDGDHRFVPSLQGDAPSRWVPSPRRDRPSRWTPQIGQDSPAHRGVQWDRRDRQDRRHGNKQDYRQANDRCNSQGNRGCGDTSR